MEIMEYKDFVQVCGILQMASDTSAKDELQAHYNDYLSKSKEDREGMQQQLLLRIKPVITKLHKMLKEVE